MYQEELREAVEDLKEKSSDTKSDMKIMAQAAKILRHETLEKRPEFSCSFNSNSEADTVGTTLKSFTHMLLDGPGIDMESPPTASSNIVTSIAQIKLHNSVGKMSKKEDGVARHIQERETQLPLV